MYYSLYCKLHHVSRLIFTDIIIKKAHSTQKNAVDLIGYVMQGLAQTTRKVDDAGDHQHKEKRANCNQDNNT